MRPSMTLTIAAIGLAAGLGSATGTKGSGFAMAGGQSAIAAHDGFSVLTYNVHGLPWPLALGRDEAFGQMEHRLQSMRRAGVQPHVVLLQEAFTARAKLIGLNSGYHYVVNGPSRDMPGSVGGTVRDLAFAHDASPTRGEALGKWLDSGLEILSDYPVVAVRRAAFPSYACAGYDCLANKGVLMVTLRVPGEPVPITIVTTHMNSKKSSGVAEARSYYAYLRQSDALANFIAANRDPRSPIVFGGDFNASSGQRRSTLLSDATSPLAADGTGTARSALQSVDAKDGGRFREALGSEVRSIARRGRDWQFFADGRDALISPKRLSVPFGLETGGTMLSDHMGFEIGYDLSARRSRSDRKPG